MSSSVTLINGTTVDSASEAWRDECLTRWKHVDTLLRLTGPGSLVLRRAYLDNVSKAEGAEARRRLEVEFADAWAKRNQAGGAGT